MGKRGNGEGSIYYSETLKRWVGQYTYNGKRKSVYAKTRTEVKNKLNKALVNILDNKYVDKTNITISDLAIEYIENLYKNNIIKDRAYKRRIDTYKIINNTNIADIPIQNLSDLELTDTLSKLAQKYSNSTIDKVYGLLNNCYEEAINKKILYTSPFPKQIIKPKSTKKDKEIRAFTVNEQKTFLNNIKDDKYEDLFKILIFTGMRIGEVLALKEEDINFYEKTIKISRTLTRDKNDKVILGDSTKTKAGERIIPITDYIYTILSKIIKNDNTNFLFLQQNGNFINPINVNLHFKNVCKKLNITDVNLHMLRHTYATRCIEAGMSPVVLQKLLGHKDISTTLNTYTSVFNKFKIDEIEKVNNYLVALKLH